MTETAKEKVPAVFKAPLGDDIVLKIGDFGISRRLPEDGDATHITDFGHHVGGLFFLSSFH